MKGNFLSLSLSTAELPDLGNVFSWDKESLENSGGSQKDAKWDIWGTSNAVSVFGAFPEFSMLTVCCSLPTEMSFA